MAENRPDNLESQFERMPSPEISPTNPDQAQTQELMENLEQARATQPSKVTHIGEYLERKPAGEPLRVSDKTQQFVDRFERAGSLEDAKKIMNEALTAVAQQEVPPDEAYLLIEKGQERLNQGDQKLAA